MSRHNKESETITISVPGTAQTIVDILQHQYGNLESGEARAKLELFQHEVWNQAEFDERFNVKNTHPPYIDVVRKQDGADGTVMFIDSPRFYFSFCAGREKDECGQS